MSWQDIGDPAIEAFDHTVGLWVTRLGQRVFDTRCRAESIKFMLADGLLPLVEQAISVNSLP